MHGNELPASSVVTIIHSFLQWFRRSADSSETAAVRTLDTDRRITALLVFIDLIVLILLASFSGDTTPDGPLAFRCVWITLAFMGMTFLYRLSAGRGILSNKTIMVTSLIIAVHLLLIVLLQVQAIRFLSETAAEPMPLFLMPYMLAPVLVSALLGRYLGAFATLCVSFFGTILLLPQNALPYIAASLVTGLVSVMLTVSLRKREQTLTSGFIAGILVFVSITTFELLRKPDESFILGHIGMAAGCAFGTSLFLGIFIGGALPLVERIFNLCTPITWLELGDMNHPLLKKLQMNAPGTFHHSIVVSRLAETAAEAVNADATQCSVSALYHDIGKLAYPQFFSENIPDPSASPHNGLTPEMSARKIIGHVAEGVELAKKHRLNSRIIDVIKEHHGLTTASYFYYQALARHNDALKQFENGQTDTKPDPVNEELFRYNGSRPQSRESGIISLADAVESAARSLKNPTLEEVEQKIDEVIKGRIRDNELRDSGLTFGDVYKIRNSFIATLKTMSHNRIAYPSPPEIPSGKSPAKQPEPSPSEKGGDAEPSPNVKS